jgi:hypothetical protein
MKKELLNEVNNIRIKMGLKVLNESSTLITEASPLLPFIEKFFLKSVIKDAEKDLFKQFIKGTLTDADKKTFNTFIKGTEGRNFIKNLESEINNVTDDAIKYRLQAWLRSNQRKLGITPKPTTQIPPKGTTTNNLTNTFNTGSIAKETEALFGNIKYTPEQIQFLDKAATKIYDGVHKLNEKEILILTDELKKFGIQIQTAINKYNQAKDIKTIEKSKKLQSMLNTVTNYINIIVKTSDKVPLYKTIKTFVKVSLGLLTIAYLTGLAFKFSNTKVGAYVKDTISNIPSPFDSAESETTPGKGNEDNVDWSKYK